MSSGSSSKTIRLDREEIKKIRGWAQQEYDAEIRKEIAFWQFVQNTPIIDEETSMPKAESSKIFWGIYQQSVANVKSMEKTALESKKHNIEKAIEEEGGWWPDAAQVVQDPVPKSAKDWPEQSVFIQKAEVEQSQPSKRFRGPMFRGEPVGMARPVD